MKFNSDEYDAWLKSLSVDDEVVISTSGAIYGCRYTITNISKITPTGIIVTSNGSRWNPDGRLRGGNSSYTFSSLTPLTNEISIIISRHKAVQRIAYVMRTPDNLTTDSLLRMDGAIEFKDEAQRG